MALFKLIPINILLTVIYIATAYLLFEVIKRKNILQRMIVLSAFIFFLSTSITSFISSKSLRITISEIALIISAAIFLIGLFVAYRKGDDVDKDRVKNVIALLFVVFLMALGLVAIARIF